MPINLDMALSAEPVLREISWTDTDVLLYHLSLGAGSRPGRPELNYTYERGLAVLPTFGLVAGSGPSSGRHAPPSMCLPGIDIDLHRVLHASQAIEVFRPIPVSGKARTSQRVANVVDLGPNRAAVLELETVATDDIGLLWRGVSQIWARGEGGFGGTRAASSGGSLPERASDGTISLASCVNQAMLYRLNGDYNPLHVDPDFAEAAGLPNPILHGLATFGMVAMGITEVAADSDPQRLTSIEARFAGTVEPGQAVAVEYWIVEADEILFRAMVDRRVVLDRGRALIAR